jgi:DNA-binding transcriptional LysR family regulator
MTANQFFTAGRVVTHSDLLTVLPESFIEATGVRSELVTRELPMAMGAVHVEMLWHRRHEADPAQMWLRAQVAAAAETAAVEKAAAPASAPEPLNR